MYRVRVGSAARVDDPPGHNRLRLVRGSMGPESRRRGASVSNMSDDPEQEHFTDGIHGRYHHHLAKSWALVSRALDFTYKNRAVKISDVAASWACECFEGSVRNGGEQVRITALGLLSDAVAGHHLWAERYDRDLNDSSAFRVRSRTRSPSR